MDLKPRNIALYVLLLIAGLAIIFSFFGREGDDDDHPEMILSDVVHQAREGGVAEIEVKDDSLTVTMKSREEFASRKEEGSNIVEILQAEDVEVGGPEGIAINVERAGRYGGFLSIIISFLPLIMFGGILIFFMRWAAQRRAESPG